MGTAMKREGMQQVVELLKTLPDDALDMVLDYLRLMHKQFPITQQSPLPGDETSRTKAHAPENKREGRLHPGSVVRYSRPPRSYSRPVVRGSKGKDQPDSPPETEEQPQDAQEKRINRIGRLKRLE
jgi:hypothetical protein